MSSTKELENAIKDASLHPFGPGSCRALPMKVIVCGLGRTGTTSMRTALDVLGFPAYHSTELWMDSQENVERWMRAFQWKYNGNGEPFDRLEWDKILGNSMSTIDAPAAFYAAELAEAYPDAKVVILNRDFDSWFDSCVAALGGRQRAGWFMKAMFLWDKRLRVLAEYMNMKEEVVWKFEWKQPGAREKARAFFDDYYSDFRARIPEERRLEFNVRDGWGPLCKHLGVEVPTRIDEDGKRVEIPFPRTNEAEQFRAKVGRMREAAQKGAAADWTRALVVGAAVGYGLYQTISPLARFLGSRR